MIKKFLEKFKMNLEYVFYRDIRKGATFDRTFRNPSPG